eukprot:7770724-Ditylum_brightwellii.AAC.1
MALKVKDLKTPCKRLSGRKKTDAEVVAVERSSRSLRQFRRERLNDPMKLSKKTRCVCVVLHGQKDVNTKDRLKKYKKAFQEQTMRQRQKRVSEVAMEIMCCCLVRNDLDK